MESNMKKILAWLLGLALVAGLAAGWQLYRAGRSQGAGDGEEVAAQRGMGVRATEGALDGVPLPAYHALIIGINNYAHWGRLRRPVQDARTLAALLRGHYGFSQVRMLLDEQATLPAITTALDDLLELKSSDSLLIFFAGHGEYNPQLDDGYWVPQEGRLGVRSDYLHNAVLARYIQRMEARHVLVVADACYSGSLLLRGSLELPRGDPAEWYWQRIAQPGRFVIASGEIETVPDDSVFATKLMSFLEYAPPGGMLSASELALRLGQEVARHTRQQVVSGRLRDDPRDRHGEFVFIRQTVTHTGGGEDAEMGRAGPPDPPEAVLPPREPPPPARPRATMVEALGAKVDAEGAWARVKDVGREGDALQPRKGEAFRALSIGNAALDRNELDLAVQSYREVREKAGEIEGLEAARRASEAEKRTAELAKRGAEAAWDRARSAGADRLRGDTWSRAVDQMREPERLYAEGRYADAAEKWNGLAGLFDRLREQVPVPTHGLVAHYPFNGNASDVSGNNLHAVNYGAVPTSDRFGHANKAYYFDGVDDFMEIAPSSILSSVGDFTITTWIKMEQKNTGNRYYIFDGHARSRTGTFEYRPGYGLIVDRVSGADSIHNFVHYSTASGDAMEQNIATSITGAWRHLVLRREGTNIITFLDGIRLTNVFAGSYSKQSAKILNMNHYLFIGTFTGNNPNYHTSHNYSFKGIIDDIRIYNRALSEEEIRALYNYSP
jgi:hypothetical protein